MSEDLPRSVSDRAIGHYLSALAAPEPTPGGGSASGIVGALGSALGEMALSLTDIDSSDHADELRDAERKLASLRERFIELAREDEKVYQGYRNAADLPKRDDEEKSIRRVAMQDALKKAAGVPMAMCEASVELNEALGPVQAHGNPHLRSDARVGGAFARACFQASRDMVEANLASIKDAEWVDEVTAHLDELAKRLDEPSVPA